MNDYDYEIRGRLILEIGRRLGEGAKGVRMGEILEAIGIKIEDPMKCREIWKSVRDDIEHSNLVDLFHESDQEHYYIDCVTLSDEGRNPERWEDLAG